MIPANGPHAHANPIPASRKESLADMSNERCSAMPSGMGSRTQGDRAYASGGASPAEDASVGAAEPSGDVSGGETLEHEYSRCPLFVGLVGVPVAIIGGGSIAAHKAEVMLGYGARVKIVASTVRPEVQDLLDKVERESSGRSDAASLEVQEHPYSPEDLDGAQLAIAATNKREVNSQVANDAWDRGIFANVVDDVEECSFIFPSSFQRGRLQIAVSTGGASPIVARSIRKDLEQTYDESWEEYLDVLAKTRVLIQERVKGGTEVRKPLYRALTTGELHQLIREGWHPSAEDAYERFAEPLLRDIGDADAGDADGQA